MAAKILMLALSPTMEKGTIVKWIATEGSEFSSGDVLCEVETDKATMDYEATSSGVLRKIVVPQGGKVEVGDVIAVSGNKDEDISALVDEVFETNGGSSETEQVEQRIDAPEMKTVSDEVAQEISRSQDHLPDGVKASPLARAIARQKGVELAMVKGSGPGGRVVKADVETFTGKKHVSDLGIVRGGKAENTLLPVSAKRQIIATRLSDSKNTAPHFYLTIHVVMDEFLSARREINSRKAAHISFNAFMIRFVAAALVKHPEMNASWNGDTIIQHGSVDIALAVAQPDGLVTPVIRDAAHKSITSIDIELHDLITRAREGTITPEEYSDATFTISNLGSFGVRQFTAIINPPNAAILAVGEVFREPYELPEGKVAFRNAMECTLSCDHRLIDGVVAAEFSRDLKFYIERPVSMLI